MRGASVRSRALGAALALTLMAAAVAALTLTWGEGGPRRLEAGPLPTETPTHTSTSTPPPTITATNTPSPTPTKEPQFNPVAKVIADSQDLIGGPLSRGRLGDYLLANDKIQVVIQAPQRNLFGIGQFGGQIIDADLVRDPNDPERDSFEEWAFGIHIENTAHYTDVTVLNDGSDGQPAVIRATGVDDLLDFINPSSQVAGFGFSLPPGFDDTDLPVEFTTDYILAPKARFVRVETTIRNTHATDPVETFLTEFFGGSGQIELFLPGYGFGEAQATTACALCNFIAWSGEDQAEGVSYGYIHDIPDSTVFSTSGAVIPLLGQSVLFALIGGVDPNYIIDPLDEITVTRYFAVGDGDVGAIVDIRNQILGLTTGTLKGTVTRGGQPAEGADVVVLGDPLDGPGTTRNVVSHYRTDASGNYEGTLPPGDYTVQAHLDGHLAAAPDPASVTVTDGGTTTQDFTIPVSGRVRVTIVDEASAAIAGKVSIVGFDAYPDPGNFQDIFGFIENNTALFGEIYEDGLPFGLAHALFVDHTGDSGEFLLEPGDYRVVVSHGSEYSIFEQDITVTAGALTTVNAQIARVIDTTGFVSGDFHVHALNSLDSEVTNEERVITMLAEGVDFFTPSDHGFRTDFAPTIASLGVGDLISFATNNEVTTADYGHFNAWPVTIDPSKVNQGAVDWARAAPAGQDFPSFGNYGLSLAEIFAALRADPGEETIQINHVDTFFGADGLAVDTALVPPEHLADALAKRLDPTVPNHFDDGFDALEIWEGMSRNKILNRLIGKNMGDWFNLINQGTVRTGVADSDTHQTVIVQAGGPRTMIASPTDDPGALGAIAETLSANVNAGRVTGTNGPFVEVTTEAASTGEAGGLALGLPTSISTTDGSATVTVEIQSPLWAEFDTVEYYINNVPVPDDDDGDPSTPPLYRVTPDVVHTAGVDFTVNTVTDFPLIPGAGHLEATDSLELTGLTEDTWVVVLVRGTDGVSKPLFPAVPNDLDQATNQTLNDLTDGNLDELGIPATAFTNPVFITFTPPPNPRMQKLPVLQNLFLTRQGGEKIPPVTCLAGNDAAVFGEKLSIPITSPDPKDPSQLQELGAFEFEMHFDDTKVCVELLPGPAAAGMTCIIEDSTNSQLEGVARIGCVSSGKDTFPDTETEDGRHLADIVVRPQPDVYSQAKPNQENGVVVQLNNVGCELADLQGQPITLFSCEDADVTIRYLEGDVQPDCTVDSLDTQGIAFRWGAEKGTLLYLDRFNLEPSGTQADDDIDIKDLQFVYGRIGSTCELPHPVQEPVNPKGQPAAGRGA